jgi:hypothetical protein
VICDPFRWHYFEELQSADAGRLMERNEQRTERAIPFDLWPAMVWIVGGAVMWASAPAAFTWWKGVVYFPIASPVVGLAGAEVSHHLRAMVAEMVDDVFPQRDPFAEAIARVLWMTLAMVEASLILIAALGLIRGIL